jgi:hypothetical protein
MACLRGGMAGAELDVAGALAMARAQGVQAPLAASLVAAAAQGVRLGASERKPED